MATAKRKRRHIKPPGHAPGSLTAHPDAIPTTVLVHRFRATKLLSVDLTGDEPLPRPGTKSVLWLDVRGLADVDRIAQIGEHFGLHPLALEDVVSGNQRAKFEAYDDHAVFMAQVVHLNEAGLGTDQLTVFLGPAWVVTFVENQATALAPIYARLEREGSRLRQREADYLAYALIDSVVDHCFPVLETISDHLEALEERALDDSSHSFMTDVQALRRNLQTLRRLTWPLRDAVASILRTPATFSETTQIFLRDVQDHTLRVAELVESQKELCATLIDLNLSATSNRMNEVMRVLTVIATVFMPLSFITGLYGMNFDGEVSALNMPELRWRFGYPYALALMAATVVGLVWYMRRQGWLGGVRSRD